MDRLLTVNEIYETESEWLFEWGKVPAQYKLDLLKAQDAKTAHLVAQEIFKDLNKYRFAEPQYIAEAGREPVIICLTENDMLAIKSKWEGENE